MRTVVLAANLSPIHWVHARATREAAQRFAALGLPVEVTVHDRHPATKRDAPSATARGWARGPGISRFTEHPPGGPVSDHSVRFSTAAASHELTHSVRDLRLSAEGHCSLPDGSWAARPACTRPMTCIRRSPAKRRVRADDDHTDHADHIPGVRTRAPGAIGARAPSTGGHDDFNQGRSPAGVPVRPLHHQRRWWASTKRYSVISSQPWSRPAHPRTDSPHRSCPCTRRSTPRATMSGRSFTATRRRHSCSGALTDTPGAAQPRRGPPRRPGPVFP